MKRTNSPRKPHICPPRRNNTGVNGVICWRGSVNLGGREHRYFVVCRGSNRRRRFNIDTLGKEEAWRRAVRCRADYETAVQKQIEIFSAQRGNAAPAIRGTTK